MPEQLLTVNQVAAVLQISRRSVYNLIAAGELRSLLVGSKRRIEQREIRRWVDAQYGIAA